MVPINGGHNAPLCLNPSLFNKATDRHLEVGIKRIAYRNY